MKKALLNLLLEDVKAVKPRDFSMDAWKMVKTKQKGNHCKTVGCAAGTYCMNHPRAQLKLIKGDEWEEDGVLTCNYQIKYKGHRHFKACAKYFDIPLEHAEFLFDPDAYCNYTDHDEDCSSAKIKREVVKRISTYIKTNGKSADDELCCDNSIDEEDYL